MIKQCVSNIALFFPASVAVAVALSFFCMLLYCLKVLKTLLPLTLLLLILCLTVSSLVPFILQQIALNNNSFYLATSLDFFTLAISGYFFFVDISYYSHSKCFCPSGFRFFFFFQVWVWVLPAFVVSYSA